MPSLGEVNLKFGVLGKRIAEYNNISLAPNNGRAQWYRILAEGEMENGSFKWKLRSAFVEALNEFGISGSEVKLPEEFNGDTKEYIEGARRQITVNAYERNAKARELCIKAHGWYCHVCEFDFESIYGELGKGYIHVHHVEPLAAKNESY